MKKVQLSLLTAFTMTASGTRPIAQAQTTNASPIIITAPTAPRTGFTKPPAPTATTDTAPATAPQRASVTPSAPSNTNASSSSNNTSQNANSSSSNTNSSATSNTVVSPTSNPSQNSNPVSSHSAASTVNTSSPPATHPAQNAASTVSNSSSGVPVKLTPPPVTAVPAPSVEQTLSKLSADKSKGLNRPVRDKWALVVGITQFESQKIPRLRYATKDAADFANYLTKEGRFQRDHVRVLLNEKATQRRILSELGSKFLARVAQPNDLVVLFFSTHGSPSQMDLRSENYLVAYDSDPDDLYSSGVDMRQILKAIDKRVMTDRVLLVLDACHSGGVDPNAKGMERVGNFNAQEMAEGSGQMVMCSSQPDEQSWESRRYPNGVFTHNLLQAMRDTSSETPITNIFESLSEKVSKEVKEDHPNARQTPVLNTSWDGNGLVLAVNPAAPEPIPTSVAQQLEPDSTGAGGQVIASLPTAKPRSTSQKSIVIEDTSPEDQAAPPDKLSLNTAYFSKEADPRKALASAYQLKSKFYNDPQYAFRAAKIKIQMGDFSSANTDLKNLLVDEPNNWQFLLAKGYCLHKLKQEGEAVDYVQQAQFHNPTLPKAIEFAD